MNRRVLATMSLDVSKDILSDPSGQQEVVFPMKKKVGEVNNVKIKLTLVAQDGSELDCAERGLIAQPLSARGRQSMHSSSNGTDVLVRQQLKKAEAESRKRQSKGKDCKDAVSDLDVLLQAACGPLEMFESLGKTRNVYVAASGPPHSRRWSLGVWNDMQDYQCGKPVMMDVDLLKVESVQGDPSRHHVFLLKYFDADRVPQILTLRRIDRARDVWVEILHILVSKAREWKMQAKQEKSERSTMRKTASAAVSHSPSSRPKKNRPDQSMDSQPSTLKS